MNLDFVSRELPEPAPCGPGLAPLLQMYVACGRRGEIGRKGETPWEEHAAERRLFCQCIEGADLVVGRKTWHRLPDWVRSQHSCWVLTNKTGGPEGFLRYFRSRPGRRTVCIGGAETFVSLLPFVESVFVTRFSSVFLKCKWFPLAKLADWPAHRLAWGVAYTTFRYINPIPILLPPTRVDELLPRRPEAAWLQGLLEENASHFPRYTLRALSTDEVSLRWEIGSDYAELIVVLSRHEGWFRWFPEGRRVFGHTFLDLDMAASWATLEDQLFSPCPPSPKLGWVPMGVPFDAQRNSG